VQTADCNDEGCKDIENGKGVERRRNHEKGRCLVQAYKWGIHRSGGIKMNLSLELVLEEPERYCIDRFVGTVREFRLYLAVQRERELLKAGVIE
jgi:hypothetical protein